MVRVFLMIIIIAAITWLLSYTITWYLDNENKKRNDIKAKKLSSLKAAQLVRKQRREQKNQFDLTDDQEDLIKKWLESGWGLGHVPRLNTIIIEDKYSMEDKKILTELREQYIAYIKNSNEDKNEKNYPDETQ